MEKLYQQIYLIRKIEEKISSVYSKEIFRCPIHLAIGHEGSAVGVCSALSSNDKVFSYHRSHHHYLAKGGNPQKLIWELLGDRRGCSAGRGGSTHLFAPEVGFMGSSAIIGNILPVASGAAHAECLSKSSNQVVVFCGDATPEEGVFFETLNMACLWNLPLLIVIEDNDLSCYTNKNVRQGYKKLDHLAALFELNYDTADGAKISEVKEKTEKILSAMKRNHKPGLLSISVFRALEHCGPEYDDPLAYRHIQGQWPERDPLFITKNSLSHQMLIRVENSTDEYLKKVFAETLGVYA